MDIATAKLIAALVVLPLILGSFVWIDTTVMLANPWYQGFKDRLFNPYYLAYFGLIAPAGIYWSQKVILDSSKSVWAVNIAAAFLLQFAGMAATYLASRSLPNSKEFIALVVIAGVTFWSRG
jgi:hypothetical protein